MRHPRFLADQDLNDRIVDGVIRREPAAEILRLRDLGDRKWSDPEILEFAASNGFIVVSHDVKTMRKHGVSRMATGLDIAGLMLVRQLDPIGPIIDSLVLIWTASDADEWINRVVFLPI
jgi:hypothetical protein